LRAEIIELKQAEMDKGLLNNNDENGNW
jgi:hypothetical protein